MSHFRAAHLLAATNSNDFLPDSQQPISLKPDEKSLKQFLAVILVQKNR